MDAFLFTRNRSTPVKNEPVIQTYRNHRIEIMPEDFSSWMFRVFSPKGEVLDEKTGIATKLLALRKAHSTVDNSN